MLKINQHTTTLSRTLLTAGLLGGAAVASLGAGSAQAAWDPAGNGYQCGWGGIIAQCERNVWTTTTVPTPGTLPTEIGTFPSDKVLALLDWGSLPGSDNPGSSNPTEPSTLGFSYVMGDMHPWHVDLDLASMQKDFDGGFLGYTMKITDPNYVFIMANLEYAAPNDSVTKAIYGSLADYQNSTNALCTLISDNSTCSITGQQIWVRDTWAASPGVGTDNISNDYAQTPAPLPILGAGAAFGSIRKLRKFSSRLKTFSMG